MDEIRVSVKGTHIQNKKTGNIIGDTYYTQRKQNHYMIKYHGFGISINIFPMLLEDGVKFVQIEYLGINGIRIYKCPLSKFVESEKRWTYHNEDIQKFVSISDMKEIKNGLT